MRYIDIRIAVNYTIALILTCKRLLKLDKIWMTTAVAPLEDIVWTVQQPAKAYSCSFPAIHQTHLVAHHSGL